MFLSHLSDESFVKSKPAVASDAFVLSRGSDGHQAVFVAPIRNLIEQRYVLIFIMETRCVFCES